MHARAFVLSIVRNKVRWSDSVGILMFTTKCNVVNLQAKGSIFGLIF